jgi:hypothetical protein
MSNTKTLELKTLDDEDLMDVVGGGCGRPQRCEAQPCHQFQPCGGLEIVVVAIVCL